MKSRVVAGWFSGFLMSGGLISFERAVHGWSFRGMVSTGVICLALALFILALALFIPGPSDRRDFNGIADL